MTCDNATHEHNSVRWPDFGELTIHGCEYYCNYCASEGKPGHRFQKAYFLRRHVVRKHINPPKGRGSHEGVWITNYDGREVDEERVKARNRTRKRPGHMIGNGGLGEAEVAAGRRSLAPSPVRNSTISSFSQSASQYSTADTETTNTDARADAAADDEIRPRIESVVNSTTLQEQRARETRASSQVPRTNHAINDTKQKIRPLLAIETIDLTLEDEQTYDISEDTIEIGMKSRISGSRIKAVDLTNELQTRTAANTINGAIKSEPKIRFKHPTVIREMAETSQQTSTPIRSDTHGLETLQSLSNTELEHKKRMIEAQLEASKLTVLQLQIEAEERRRAK